MSLWKVAWRSIRQRSLASALTALSIALGVALVVAVLVIHSVVDRSFRRGSQGYDLIVGAKGGQLRLVLNTVFYLGEPIENIPYDFYREFVTGRYAEAVETAVPVCMGHAYKSVPVVATVGEMFEKLTYLNNRKYRFAEGANFEEDDFYGAVAGAAAARKIGLKLGDTFRPVGLARGGHVDHQDEPFKVVGILEPTGTPNDNALFINMEGFFRCPAHMVEASSAEKFLQSGEHHHHDHVHKEVTAILVCTRLLSSDGDRRALAMSLPQVINKGSVAQAVHPSRVIANFFDTVVGNVQLLLLVLATLVVVVAGIGIMVSIYNSMSDRRHEIAVMRALGASRMTVMAVILMESILLALGGGVLGVALGHGLIGALGPTFAEHTGVGVSAFQFQLVELILIPGLIILATLVGYLPAVAAYRTDVAKSLTATQ